MRIHLRAHDEMEKVCELSPPAAGRPAPTFIQHHVAEELNALQQPI